MFIAHNSRLLPLLHIRFLCGVASSVRFMTLHAAVDISKRDVYTPRRTREKTTRMFFPKKTTCNASMYAFLDHVTFTIILFIDKPTNYILSPWL
jgi:hypothetical protein